MEEDIDVDDIFQKKPKKIKSGKKGKRVELELVNDPRLQPWIFFVAL